MIELVSVSKRIGVERETLFENLSGVFEANSSYVIFGAPDSGKSTLLYLLCGLEKPTGGRITRHGSVGIPAGYGNVRGGWDSVYTYVRFLAQLYDSDPAEIVSFVADFADLHDEMTAPLASLDANARRRFFFTLGYAIPVDFYLFDNVITWRGDRDFERKCLAAFESRRSSAATIVTTRNVAHARRLGDRGAVLHDGQLDMFDSVVEAIDAFERLALASQFGSISFARTLLARGDVEGAREYLAEYQSHHPEDVSGYELQATLAYRAADYQAAATAASLVLERAPRNVDAHCMLARIAMRDSSFQAAADHAREALIIAPGHSVASALLAKSQQAADEAARRTSDSNAQENAQEHSASLLQKLKHWKEAIRTNVKADNWSTVLETVQQASAETRDPDLWSELRIRALLETGQVSEAEAPLLLVASRDFDSALGLLLRAAKKRRIGPLQIASLLGKLCERHPKGDRSSPMFRGIVKALELEAQDLRKKGDVASLRTIRRLILSLDPKLPRQTRA